MKEFAVFAHSVGCMLAAVACCACTSNSLDVLERTNREDASAADTTVPDARVDPPQDGGVETGCETQRGRAGELDEAFRLRPRLVEESSSWVQDIVPARDGFLLFLASVVEGPMSLAALAEVSERGELVEGPHPVAEISLIAGGRETTAEVELVGTTGFDRGVRLVNVGQSGTRVAEIVPGGVCPRGPGLLLTDALWDAAGRLLITGRVATCGDRFESVRVYRFIGNQLDTSYGDGGMARLQWTPGTITELGSSEIQSDGSLLLPVSVETATHAMAGVIRLLPSGELDESFGTDGFGLVPPRLSVEVATGVVTVADGVVGVGRAQQGGEADVLVFRLTAEGQIDSAFGDQGSLRFGGTWASGADGPMDWANAAVADPYGGVLVVGNYDQRPGRDMLIARVDEQGLDTSFGSSGLVLLGPGSVPRSEPRAFFGGAISGMFDACGGFVFGGALDGEATLNRLAPW